MGQIKNLLLLRFNFQMLLHVKKNRTHRFKTTLFALAICIGINLNAQVPDGYYSSADNLTGAELKAALHNIIKNHIKFPYTSSTTDVWDILKETDRDPKNAANVILIYSGVSVNAAQEYNNANGWTREHVWAKSRGNLSTDTPGPGTDVHNLRPEDDNTNSKRSNYWFDYCSTSYDINGLPTGNYFNTTNHTWEPRDAVKGDVARIIFYMDVRYEGTNGEIDLKVIDYFPTDYYTNEPVHAKLATLLEWNRQDPPDDFERNRNDVIYSKYQKNRNPFIDKPELVDKIWTVTTTIIEKPKVETLLTIFPNPSTGSFTVQTDNSNREIAIRVINSAGMEVLNRNYEGSIAQLEGFSHGIYSVIIKTDNAIEFKKLVVVNN